MRSGTPSYTGMRGVPVVQAGGAAPTGARVPGTRVREVIGVAQQAGQQRCRRCDCVIRQRAYEKNGVTYCCEACAERFECECGCIIFDSG